MYFVEFTYVRLPFHSSIAMSPASNQVNLGNARGDKIEWRSNTASRCRRRPILIIRDVYGNNNTASMSTRLHERSPFTSIQYSKHKPQACRPTSLYDMAKRVIGVFLLFVRFKPLFLQILPVLFSLKNSDARVL